MSGGGCKVIDAHGHLAPSTMGCVVFAPIGEDEMRDILYANTRRLLDESLRR